ncbi:MAG: hypothetical protein K2P81_07410 [Bacteriovoracaceae bacterium]|nr:hypothetical protein [Bacteriovoracaceae bacterium]
MKLFILLALFSFSALAGSPALTNLSKSDLEKVSNEIAVNFSHTAVAAPETKGIWGIEVGLVAGVTGSPKLKDLVDNAGEDGSKFKRLPHAGLMARVHVPGDIFAEMSFIPTTKASGLELSNKTFALGWNAGSFFQWPLDVAIGGQISSSKLQYDQVVSSVASTVTFEPSTSSLWIGASKEFFIFTPYVKLGTFKSDTDVKVDGSSTIFAYTTSQKETVSSSGGFGAVGVNVQLLAIRLGFEASRAAEVGRVSGKLSLAF